MAIITVDDKEIEVQEGALLIEELLAHGINIPHFCYHSALGKDGNCRMCMVEVEGKKRPQIACDIPAKEGMIIRTKGENIERVKRSILELELINHPIDCPICDQAGECDLQNYYMDVGLYNSRLNTPKVKARKKLDIGSNVILDQERCVLCTRCVRFTANITKTKELGVENRGDRSVITTFPGRPLDNPYAMNVVDICPVGALTSKDFRFHKRVWLLKPEAAICNGCARGCSIWVDHHKAKYEADSIFRYRPRKNMDINGYFICDYGRLSYKQENKNRQAQAYIRGTQSEYEYAQGKFLRLLKRHHGKICFLLSASLSLEEMSQVKQLAHKYKAHISGFDDKEYDDEFGDDYLRCSDLASNRNAFRVLDIDTSEESIALEANAYKLLILFGREDIDTIKDYSFEAKAIVSPRPPLNHCENCDLYLPMLTHTSRQGSFINTDGFIQFTQAHVENQAQSKSLVSLCAEILEDGVFTCKEVWENGLQEKLPQIDYTSLIAGKNTQKVQL